MVNVYKDLNELFLANPRQYCIEGTASMDVDAQKGFTPLCPNELPVEGGHNIVKALNEQSKFALYRVGSKDWHSPNAAWIANETNPQFTPCKGLRNVDLYWNAHCIAGTTGAELLDGLPRPEDYDFMVYKGMEPDMHPYGACYHDLEEKISTGLIEFLKIKKVWCVIVGGLATDYCVKKTVFQLAKHFTVIVNLSACRAVTQKKSELDIVIQEFKNVSNILVVGKVITDG
jgi:nicotinamidase/pyrazinamidase